ncbi:DUF11 domain-containing protein, partial [Flavobacterium sufflavum]
VITTPNSPATTITGVAAGTSVTVKWTVTNGTCSAFDNVTLQNNAAPTAPISGGNITECMAPSIQTLTAMATVPSGQHIDWYTSAIGGNLVNNPTLNIVGTVTYYAQAVNNETNCISLTRTPVILTINSCSIKITKDGTYQDTNHDGITNIGDNVIYNFVVTNTSNVTLTNVKVTDINAVVSGGPLASLAAGVSDNSTFTAIHAITQNDIDTGFVYNWATVVGTPPTGSDVRDTSTDPTPCTTCPINPECPDCTITPLTQSPKIAIVKNNNITTGENGCAALKVGDVVTYTFTVTNPGNVSLHNVNVSDPHTGLSAIALQSGGDANTNNILEVNETWIFKANYTVTQADIDAGKITNRASVNALAPDNSPVNDSSGNTPTTNEDNVITICTTPKIAIVKSNNITTGENGCATLKVGDVVTYTFTVTNPGNVSLHNINVSDPHTGLSAIALQSGGDTNTNNILEVNETWIFKASYTVMQEDIDAGRITNRASVSGLAPDNSPVNDSSGNTPTTNEDNVIPICTTPKIAIVKTNNITVGENGCAALKVGDVVTYTFTVTNPGNVSLHNVNVSDPHTGLSAIALQSGGDANTNNILEVNETWIFKASYTVTQADIDAGKITNRASVSGLAPDNSPVNDLSGNSPTTNEDNIIIICTTPKIAIVKSNNITVGENGCAVLTVGDVVTYTFTVTNPGNVSLHNVNVSDPHTGLSAIALQSGGDANTNNILEVNETWIFKASYTVTQADIDAGRITNRASVSGLAPDNSPVNDLSGNSPTTNEDNVIIICTTPKIAIVKSNNITVGENGCAALKVGDVVTYTFTVTNPGNVSLHNVNVSDPHTGLSAIALQSGGDANTNNILEVNETWIFKANYTVTQADIDAGKITNRASVSGLAPDNSQVNDSSGSTPTTNEDNVITICTTPKITITKEGIFEDTNGNGVTNVGDKVKYTFIVTNTGNTTLTNITVIDEKIPNLSITGGSTTLAIGSSTTFTASYTITQADIDAGFVYNLARVTGTPPIGSNVTATSTDPTPCTNCPIKEDCPACTITVLTQKPGIALVKTSTFIDTNNDGFAQVGEKINYVFAVTNTGNVTITNIAITDNQLPGLTISNSPIVSLAVGVTNSSVIGTYTITQADIDAGKVTNTALAIGKDPKGADVRDVSGTTVNNDTPTDTALPQKPGIALVKTGTFIDTNNDSFAQVGEKINYVFTVTNTGNVTVTNIAITDDQLPGLTISNSPIVSLSVGATNSSVIGVYTITQADIDAGRVTNTALAIGKDPKGADVKDVSGTTIQNDTPTITTLPQSPGLNVDKTAVVTSRGSDSDVYSFVGDVITYTINVTNTGNIILHNIVVKDPLTGLDTTNEPFSLAPGEHKEIVQTHAITVDDLKGNSITNIATANGLTPNNTPITAEDTVVVEKAQVLGCGTIVVHNAFSPNGDEFNDKFKIDNIEDTLCYPENSVEIYNRWGILVYETKGYDNVNNVFKGYSEGRVTVDKNAGLPTGTYFYVLKYTAVGLQGETITKQEQGYLYLTR